MRRTEVLQGLRQMKFEEVYERTGRHALSQADAASILGMSERTFRRWRDRFEAEGAEGLYDRRLGKISGRRVAVDTVMAVLDLFDSRYWDFTAKHFHEKLVEEHGFTRSYNWTHPRTAGFSCPDRRPKTISYARSARQILSRRCIVRSKTFGCSTCSRSNSSRPTRHGSSSNQARSSAVTAASGSGRRRPRFGCGFGWAVGRTSPIFHAVRSPERNTSICGALSAMTIPGVSAISTNRCCAERMSRNRRIGSSVAAVAVSRCRTSSDVRGSASNR